MPHVPDRPPVSDLTAHLGFWLRPASNPVSSALAGKLAGQGVTVADWTRSPASSRRPPAG
ncbi:MarR family transcriptional regulator, partial [Amaricoccus sp. HAR-UPW-R2A-40]